MLKFKKRRQAKKPIKRFFFRKKTCNFCTEKVRDIDYKDVAKLNRFISERGKMAFRRTSGVCARHQRKLSSAIKRARYIALLPFIKK